jgi:hypothetical protein
MSKMQINTIAVVAAAALVLGLAPAPVLAGGARLEGYLLGVDGRAAVGHRVHLVDDKGEDVAQSATTREGIYRFREMPAGEYSLGIENPDGAMAPVAAPPVRLGEDELVRRDIKLVEAGPEQQERVGRENYSFGTFWAGLSPGAKAWSVIGTFVVLGIAVTALDDEDDGTEVDND